MTHIQPPVMGKPFFQDFLAITENLHYSLHVVNEHKKFPTNSQQSPVFKGLKYHRSIPFSPYDTRDLNHND